MNPFKIILFIVCFWIGSVVGASAQFQYPVGTYDGINYDYGDLITPGGSIGAVEVYNDLLFINANAADKNSLIVAYGYSGNWDSVQMMLDPGGTLTIIGEGEDGEGQSNFDLRVLDGQPSLIFANTDPGSSSQPLYIFKNLFFTDLTSLEFSDSIVQLSNVTFQTIIPIQLNNVTLEGSFGAAAQFFDFGAGTSTLSGTVLDAFSIEVTGTLVLTSTAIAPNISLSGGGTLVISSPTNLSTSLDLGSGILANANAMTISTNIFLEGGTIDTSGGDLTISSTLSGGTLIKSGTNALILSGTNTYTGGTVLQGGTISLRSRGALGTTGAITFSGGALQYTSTNTTDYSSRFNTGAGQLYNVDTNGQNVTWATALTSTGGSLTKNGAGSLALTGSNTYDGATTIDAGTLQLGNSGTSGWISSMSVADSGTLAFARSDNVSYGGNITGSGGVSQIGSGTVTLTGTNSYTGGTLISAGTLQAGNGTALASGTSGADYVVNGGKLDLNSYNLTMSSLAGSGGSVALGTAALTVDQDDATTFAGAITGAGGFTKIGGGSLTLSGTSNFNGSLSPNEGTLNITGGVTNASTSGIATTGTTATVNVTGPGASWTDNADTLIGFNGGTGYLNISNGAYVSDTFSLVGRLAANDAGYVTVTGTGSMWYHSSGLVVGTGGIGVLNVDSGGTVEIESGGAGSITLGDFAGSSGILNIGAAAGQTALAPGTIEATSIIGGSGTAVVNFNQNGTDYIFAPDLTGNLSVQQNAGTTILTGTNTYTGGTQINGGTLVVSNNSALGTGAATITSGTLQISSGYQVDNTIILAGGSLARQIGAETQFSALPNFTSAISGGTPTTAKLLSGQSSGTATINGGFTHLSAALNDSVRTGDVFTLSGVSVVNPDTKQTDVFTLQLQLDPSLLTTNSELGWLDPSTNMWTNAVNGNIGGTATFIAGAYNATTDDQLGDYGVDPTTGTVWAVLDHNSSFTVMAVPEPSTWISLGLSLIALIFYRRRESKTSFLRNGKRCVHW